MTPIGIRSNNPLNLRPDGWIGEIGVNAKGFAIFDTMEHGIRAAARNLMAYQDKHGIETIGPVDRNGNSVPVSMVGKPGIKSGIVCRWSTTDQQPYIDHLCHVCELKPNDLLDLHEFNTLWWVIQAQAEFENGHDEAAKGITDRQLTDGVRMAIDGTA